MLSGLRIGFLIVSQRANYIDARLSIVGLSIRTALEVLLKDRGFERGLSLGDLRVLRRFTCLVNRRNKTVLRILLDVDRAGTKGLG